MSHQLDQKKTLKTVIFYKMSVKQEQIMLFFGTMLAYVGLN